MELIGILGLLIGVVAIIYLSARGMNINIAAVIAAFIVIITNQMNIMEGFLGAEPSYMQALAGFIIDNFGIFLMGTILSQYMDKSGALLSIANTMLEKIGTKNKFAVLCVIALIVGFLTYGGINVFVVLFAVVPFTRPIFKRLNLNWKLASLPIFLGMATVTLSILPGTPSIQNIIPTQTLGTPLTAAPIISIIASVAVIIFGLLYMKWALNRSIKKGEKFYDYLEGNQTAIEREEKKFEAEEQEKELPSVFKSVLPMVTLIAIVLTFADVPNIVLIGLTISVFLAAILFHSYIPEHQVLLSTGASTAVPAVFNVGSVIGFGTLVTMAPAFANIQDLILGIPGSPLIGLSVVSALLGGITGSSNGAIAIVMETMIADYVALGINKELLHRTVVVGAGVLTHVPQSGITITFNNISGLSLKHGFKEQFIIVGGGHFIALLIILIFGPMLV